MKKATTKRERKYGKKQEKVVEEVVKKQTRNKPKPKEVSVMVDMAVIRKFKTKELADKYINKQHKEDDEARRPRTSFIFV